MKLCSFLLLALLFFACGNPEPQSTQTEQTTEQATPNSTAETETTAVTSSEAEETPPARMPSTPPQQFEKSLTDGKVTFKINSQNGEVSKVNISTEGLENRQFTTDFQVEGQLEEAYLLDLNDDSFSEIYLVFSQTDDTGNFMLKGWSSYRNKSAGEIYVKDSQTPRRKDTDRVYVQDGKLYRTFETDGGEQVSLSYKLSKGESSFVLEPEKS